EEDIGRIQVLRPDLCTAAQPLDAGIRIALFDAPGAEPNIAVEVDNCPLRSAVRKSGGPVAQAFAARIARIGPHCVLEYGALLGRGLHPAPDRGLRKVSG